MGVITPVTKYNAHVPKLWQEIILGCLKPNREQRFQNVEEILKRLEYQALTQTTPIADLHFKLLVLDGEEHGKVIPVKVTGPTTIGRLGHDCSNDICIREQLTNYISRRHATFEYIKGKVYLRDGQWEKESKKWRNSKNGTFINGRSIYDQGDNALNYLDIITIGNTSLKIIK